tara:strand:+ start:453 stop:2567 length:2115 start_codon:yes stop_codon:yes gene_type:complete
MTTHSTDVFARLLAAENLVVVHDASAETASFDLDSRVLTLPVWDTMSGHVYDMLVSHEVSHALNTPLEGWKKELDAAGANASLVQHYINVVEDVRIERMIQAKFPGLRPDYKAGRQWMKDNIMGDVLADVANGKAHSIDHVNLFAKGMLDATDLTADEMAMYDRCYACETFDEVVTLAKEFLAELPEKEENGGDASDGNAQGEGQEGGEGAARDEQAEGNAQGDDDANADGEGQDQSENAQANSEAKGDGSMESADDAKDDGSNADSDDQRSEAAKKMDAAMKGLINRKASEHQMKTLPAMGDRMSDFLITAEEVIASKVGSTIIASDIATRNYTNLQAEQKAMVNHMVNLFNQKRSATAHKRARRAKTGVLDTVKMTNYKWSEDIFRQIKVVPEGKNHGFFMLVDWSGSMSDKIIETVKQTIMLAEFCRRVNVPFRVAAFSSTAASYLRSGSSPEKIEGLESLFGVSLVEYLSSDLKKADFDKAAAIFFDGAIGSTYDKSSYKCSGYKFDSLGSTPLDEGIMIASERMMQMRAAGKCEIMNLIILTDGEASSDMFTSSGWRDSTSGATATDPISGLRFNTVNNWETRRNSTAMALDVLRARVGDVNIVGIYLAGNKRDYQDFWHTQRDLDGAAQWDPKQRLYAANVEGYEKYFIFVTNTKPVKGLDSVDSTDSKAKVRNALIREGKDRKDRKTFLNQLFDMVA